MKKQNKKTTKKKKDKDDVVLNYNKSNLFSDEKFEKIENPFIELFKEHLPKQIILISIIVVLIIFLFFNLNKVADFCYRLLVILTPVIYGWALAFMMSPIFDFVVNKISQIFSGKLAKFAKQISTVICTFFVLGLTIGLLFLFIPQLTNSIVNFFGKTNRYLTSVMQMINGIEEMSNNDLTRQLLLQANEIIEDMMVSVKQIDFSIIISRIYSGFYISLKVILNFFVGLVVMIYTLNMKEEFAKEMKKSLFAIVRLDIAKKILAEVRFAKKVFTGFFVGKVLDSLIIGILCYIGCMIIGMPYTPLIAVIVGLTNIIPFFGPFIGAIPSFLLILLEEPLSLKPIVFLVFILILQQLDGNVIGPKILGDKTGVGSFWVLFSILLFGGLFGFIGMIIAVPTWAVITRLFDEFVTLRLKEKNYPLTSEEYKKLKEYNQSLQNTEIV